MMQVNGAVAESVHAQQFEPGANVVGKRPLAASHQDWKDHQVVLVDQAGSDGLGREVGTAHADVSPK
jgi:hypothetical protein